MEIFEIQRKVTMSFKSCCKNIARTSKYLRKSFESFSDPHSADARKENLPARIVSLCRYVFRKRINELFSGLPQFLPIIFSVLSSGRVFASEL